MRRRTFLQTTAATVATMAHVGYGAAQGGDRIKVAVVGVNGKGQSNLDGVAGSGLAEIVALCDVDESRATSARRAHPQARFFADYRRMLEDLRDVQAVVISTPDHHHAMPALMAMRRGLHVYCEKPLAHTVQEVRLMREEAARRRVVTQMGTQIHANENYHRVVEIVRAGVIGAVRRVHVWCSSQVQAGHRVTQRTAPPEGLHYDLWLGPAPEAGYPPFRTGANASVHFHWRWWWEFGGGVLADMACHFMDLPHWSLDLGLPTSVSASGRVTHGGENPVPDKMQVEFEYPARGERPPVHLTWYHGVTGPDLAGNTTYRGYGSGVLFEGERGSLIADYGKYALLPEDRFRDVRLPERTLARSPGHHREWLLGIKEGRATSCPFSYSGLLAETVLLGNVAYHHAPGTRIAYDGAAGRVTSHDAANRFLARDRRPGWSLT